MILTKDYKVVEDLKYVIKKGDLYNKSNDEYWYPISGSVGLTFEQAIRCYGVIKFATKNVESIKPRFKNNRPFPHGY